MTPSATFRWIGITTFVLAAAGSATAQPANGAPAADAQVGFQRRVQLSPQDELAEANTAIEAAHRAFLAWRDVPGHRPRSKSPFSIATAESSC